MCAAANYKGQTVNDGFGTLRRFRKRISSILTIPEYLSEMQVFQMRNVSVKTKNGLKDAQKSVKGRPNVPRKAVISQTARRSVSKVYDSLNRIMNSDRPPQIPGKDYHHYTSSGGGYHHQTPDVDDDGWGSDFSGNDSDPEQDSYEFPSSQGHERTDEVYEDPEASSGNDSEYEQPIQAMPQPAATSRNTPATSSRLNRPLPTSPSKSPVKQSRPFLGNRELPPEPPQEQEDYENPDDLTTPIVQPRNTPPAHKHLPPAPIRKKSPPMARSPRKPSPSAPHGSPSLPPPLPRRDIPAVAGVKREVEKNNNSDPEDYEEPTTKILPPQPKPHIAPVNSEIIHTAGKLKPSLLKNYTKVDIPNKGNPLVTGAPVKPSQLREKKTTPVSHHIKPTVQEPPVPKQPHSRAQAVNSRVLPPIPQEDAVESLNSYTWFHCDMTRDVANDRLLRKTMNGMFLVRKSSKYPYALSLFYKDRVYNLNIRLRTDNKFALGTIKPDEKAFTSVPLLVSYFQNNALVLGGNTSNQTTLKQALPK